jgi:hypothetical protein
MQSLQDSRWVSPEESLQSFAITALRSDRIIVPTLVVGFDMHSHQMSVLLYHLGDFLTSKNLKENVD